MGTVLNCSSMAIDQTIKALCKPNMERTVGAAPSIPARIAAMATQRTQPPSSEPTNATAQKPQTIMKSPRLKATGPVKESANCFNAESQGNFELVFASAIPLKERKTNAVKTDMINKFLFLFLISCAPFFINKRQGP
jgi:hypothetical protein